MARAGLFGGFAPTSDPSIPPQHGSLFNTADGLLGGWLGYGGRQAAAQAAAAQAAKEAQTYRARVESTFGDDPVAMIAASANPVEFAKNLASQYAAANVDGGATRVYGKPGNAGGATYTAPKLVEDGGIYGTQSAGGYSSTGARGPSIAENQTAVRDTNSNINALTPEGFLPRMDQSGKVIGFDLDPSYGAFAKEKAAAGATRVSVPITLPAQNKFAEAMAGNYAADLGDMRSQAQAAQKSIGVLQNVAGLIDKADTGLLAGPKLGIDRGLSAIGLPGAKDRVEATQTLDSQLNSLVLPLVKQLGSSNSITDSDREFIGKVVGSKSLDAGTLRKLIDIQQRDAAAKVNQYQRMGKEAFQAVPPAQGLPPSAFGMGTQTGGSAAPTVRRYNPATGRLE